MSMPPEDKPTNRPRVMDRLIGIIVAPFAAAFVVLIIVFSGASEIDGGLMIFIAVVAGAVGLGFALYASWRG